MVSFPIGKKIEFQKSELQNYLILLKSIFFYKNTELIVNDKNKFS